MKLVTIRNIRALLTSRQCTFTGDQLVQLVEIVSELNAAEKIALRVESSPAVPLGGGALPIVDHTPDEAYVEALSRKN